MAPSAAVDGATSPGCYPAPFFQSQKHFFANQNVIFFIRDMCRHLELCLQLMEPSGTFLRRALTAQPRCLGNNIIFIVSPVRRRNRRSVGDPVPPYRSSFHIFAAPPIAFVGSCLGVGVADAPKPTPTLAFRRWRLVDYKSPADVSNRHSVPNGADNDHNQAGQHEVLCK